MCGWMDGLVNRQGREERSEWAGKCVNAWMVGWVMGKSSIGTIS